MRLLRIAAVGASMFLWAAGPHASSQPTAERGTNSIDAEPPPCYGIVTPPTHATLDADDSVPLNVLVLVDGAVAPEDVSSLLQTSGLAFSHHGYELRLTVEAAHVSAQDGDSTEDFLDRIRRSVGGRTPAAHDVVVGSTTADFAGGQAGRATCLGGYASDRTAFAVSTIYPSDLVPTDPLIALAPTNLTALVFSHELLHLLGASHAYANCPEGIMESPTAPRCTVMIDDVGLATQTLSTLNRQISHGLVQEHRRDGDRS